MEKLTNDQFEILSACINYHVSPTGDNIISKYSDTRITEYSEHDYKIRDILNELINAKLITDKYQHTYEGVEAYHNYKRDHKLFKK